MIENYELLQISICMYACMRYWEYMHFSFASELLENNHGIINILQSVRHESHFTIMVCGGYFHMVHQWVALTILLQDFFFTFHSGLFLMSNFIVRLILVITMNHTWFISRDLTLYIRGILKTNSIHLFGHDQYLLNISL